MERKKLEQILDQVAERWFVGIEAPTKFAKVKKQVAMGKKHTKGYPQLMQLKENKISCPLCHKITSGLTKINLRTNIQTYECGCKSPFFRL